MTRVGGSMPRERSSQVSSAVFLAHSDPDKPFVRATKSNIIRLLRMRRVRTKWPERAGISPADIYFDEDSADPTRRLDGFSHAAANAQCMLVIVPRGGINESSFIRKELLAFLTGIQHTSREQPDPESLTDEQALMAKGRLSHLLLVDRHDCVRWSNASVYGLTELCRSGCLSTLFERELPRLRETANDPRRLAVATISRLWQVPAEQVEAVVAQVERRRRAAWLIAALSVASVFALLFFVALAARNEANRQRDEAETAKRNEEGMKHRAEEERDAATRAREAERQAKEQAQAARAQEAQARELADKHARDAIAAKTAAERALWAEAGARASALAGQPGAETAALLAALRGGGAGTDDLLSVFREGLGAAMDSYRRRLPLHGHRGPINGATFTVDSPLRLAATTSEDGTARIWNINTGECLHVLAHPGITAASFSRSGAKLLTGGGKLVTLWLVATGTPLLKVQHASPVSQVAYSPVDDRFLTLTVDGELTVWDQHGQKLGRQTKLGRQARFSPSGEVVAAIDGSGNVKYLDGNDLRELTKLAVTSPVHEVAYSRDGRHLASVSGTGADLWDGATGNHIATIDREKHHYDLNVNRSNAVAFSFDGKEVAISDDDRVQVWNRGAERSTSLIGHHGIILGAAFSSSGYVFTGGMDGTGRMWETGGQQVTQFDAPSMATVVAFSRAEYMLAGTRDGSAWVWRPRYDASISTFDQRGARFITAAHRSPQAVVVRNNGRVSIFDRQRLQPTDIPDISDAEHAVISPVDNSMFVTRIRNGEWRSAKGVLLMKTAPGAAGFLANGDLLLVTSQGTAQVLSSARRSLLYELTVPESARALAVVPASDLAVLGADRAAYLIDVRKRAVLWKIPESGNTVSVSSSGDLLSLASEDGTVSIWQLSKRAQVWRQRVFLQGASSATLSPNGRLLLAFGLPGPARVYDVASGRLIAILRGDGMSQAGIWWDDGSKIMTASQIAGLKVFDVSPSRLLKDACLLLAHSGQSAQAARSCGGSKASTAASRASTELLAGASVLEGDSVAEIRDRTKLSSDAIANAAGKARQALARERDGEEAALNAHMFWSVLAMVRGLKLVNETVVDRYETLSRLKHQ